MSDRLRAAFLDGLEQVSPGTDCGDPARIWAAFRGELDPAESRTLVDHALDCARCAMAWRMAREVGAEAARTLPARRGWRAAHWAAVAAGIAMAVLLPVGVHEWRRPAPAIYRETGPAVVPLVADGATLPRSAFLLRWEPVVDGARYSVRVARADLRVVAETDALVRTEYQVPAEALADLPSGTGLFWRVEAHLPDGNHVVSDLYSVRLE